MTREWAARFALASFGIGLPLASAELALRALGWEPRRQSYVFRTDDGIRALNFPDRASHLTLDCYPAETRRSFPVDLRVPDVRARYEAAGLARIDFAAANNPLCVESRYNRDGFREREREPKAPGSRRVVFIGDSFLEGQGVAEPLTAVRLVEASLAAHAPGWQAFNLGIRGRDLPEMSESFSRALELAPDVIVFAMVLNDVERDASLARAWPAVDDWIMLRLPDALLGRLDARLLAFVRERIESRRLSRQTLAWYRALYSQQNREGLARTGRALRSMKQRASASGIGFGIALWPLLVDLEGAYPLTEAHARIRDACARHGIPFVDLLEVLRGRRSRDLWASDFDHHPNATAHALVRMPLRELVLRAEAERAPAPPAAAGASRP